jgi:hypothetical protein
MRCPALYRALTRATQSWRSLLRCACRSTYGWWASRATGAQRKRESPSPAPHAFASAPRSGGAARLSAADFAPFLEALRLDVDALALDGAAAGALVRLAALLP